MSFNEKKKPEIVFVESPFAYTNGLITSSRVNKNPLDNRTHSTFPPLNSFFEKEALRAIPRRPFSIPVTVSERLLRNARGLLGNVSVQSEGWILGAGVVFTTSRR